MSIKNDYTLVPTLSNTQTPKPHSKKAMAYVQYDINQNNENAALAQERRDGIQALPCLSASLIYAPPALPVVVALLG